MKRGFMDRNQELLSLEQLTARQKKFIEDFQEYNIDAAVIYGDVASADELQYLTNLGPYWSNAAVIIFKDGRTLVVTGLSARVDPWVAMITGIDQSSIIAAGPKINTKVASVLKEQLGAGTIGVTGSYFPQEMAAAIEGAGFKTVVYQKTLGKQLAERDGSYISTLKKGIGLMNAAIAEVLKKPELNGMTKKRVAADVEYACRTAGAMDMLILNGNEQLVFDQPQEVVENEKPWTLYVQIQYLGEWFVVARNMKPGYGTKALSARDKGAIMLKPGEKRLEWEEDGFTFSVCTKILSDHISYRNKDNSALLENQIVSLKVADKNKGIYLEDMFMVTSAGGQLLTDI